MKLIKSFTINHRQVRLWKAEGQNAIEKSHVCLLYANTVGCEALKNLILPGIGYFKEIILNRRNRDWLFCCR